TVTSIDATSPSTSKVTSSDSTTTSTVTSNDATATSTVTSSDTTSPSTSTITSSDATSPSTTLTVTASDATSNSTSTVTSSDPTTPTSPSTTTSEVTTLRPIMSSTSGTTTVLTGIDTLAVVAVSTLSTPSLGLTSRDTTLVTTIKTTVAECMSDALLNVIRLEDVTSKLISVSWTGITLDQQIQYKVKLASNSNTTQIETSATKAVFSDLTPGTIYTLIIEYLSCDIKKNISRDIITAGKVYESSTRIPGREFLSDYSNQSSKLYKDFVANFTMQVENNLPKAYQDLTRAKEMVVVVTEADVCQRGDYTCSKNASCVREGPSHSCECKAGFYDENPTVPGTDCKRNISPGADPCKGLCSSCAQCVVGPGGSHECSCYPGLIDQNPVNPGKLCKGTLMSSASIVSVSIPYLCILHMRCITSSFHQNVPTIDPVDCFDQEKDICSSQNICLPSKFLCSCKF
ncbi:unnamed protein product, partial [Oncorhynchus mykiss]